MVDSKKVSFMKSGLPEDQSEIVKATETKTRFKFHPALTSLVLISKWCFKNQTGSASLTG